MADRRIYITKKNTIVLCSDFLCFTIYTLMYHPQQNYNSTRLQTVKYSLFGPFINPRGRITLRTPGLYLQTVQCVNRCVLLSISSPCNMQQYSHFINMAQQMPNGLTESSAITAKWRFKSLSTPPPHTHSHSSKSCFSRVRSGQRKVAHFHILLRSA